MKKLFLAFVTLLAPALGFAGSTSDNVVATVSLSVPHSATPPSNQCLGDSDRGKIYVDTNAPSGQQLYACEGSSGWKVQGAAAAATLVAIDTGTLGSLPLTRLSTGTLPTTIAASSVTANSVPNAAIVSVAAAKITGTLPITQVSGTLPINQLGGGATIYAQIDPAARQAGGVDVTSSKFETIIASGAYGAGGRAIVIENESPYAANDGESIIFRQRQDDGTMVDYGGIYSGITSLGGLQNGDIRILRGIDNGASGTANAPVFRAWKDVSTYREDFGSQNSIDGGGVTVPNPILGTVGNSGRVEFTNSSGKLVLAALAATGVLDNTTHLRGDGVWDSTAFLTESSATATYLQASSATATYQPIGSYLTSSSATATYLQASSATATYVQKTDNISGSRIVGGTLGITSGANLTNLTATSINAGSLGASVVASSVTASVFQTGLSAGSNITLTNTAAGVQIAASSGTGASLTSTQTFSGGDTFTSSITAQGPFVDSAGSHGAQVSGLNGLSVLASTSTGIAPLYQTINVVISTAGTSLSGTATTNVCNVTASAGTQFIGWNINAAQTSTASSQMKVIVTYSDGTTSSVTTGATQASYVVGNSGGLNRFTTSSGWVETLALSLKAVTSLRIETAGSGVGTRGGSISAIQVPL